MNKKNTLQLIEEVYLKGFSLQDAADELPFIQKRKIAEYYNSITLESSRERANKSEGNLFQIRKIERELFNLIESNKKKPTAEVNQQIAELQETYSKYLIS